MIESIDISNKEYNNLVIPFKIVLNIDLIFDFLKYLILSIISILG